MATSLSSFVDGSVGLGPSLGMVVGGGNLAEDSLGSLYESGSGFGGFGGLGNSSGNGSLFVSGNGSRGAEMTPDVLQELLQLHSDYEKFVNLTAEAQCSSGDNAVYDFASRYKRLHGYIALFVCAFGVIANALIMVVLTRKEMKTPVNHMLLALAIADLLIMVEYIPFALHMYIIDNEPETKYSWAWACFVFFHVHFTQILHTISIQLTLTMAIWRYAAIKGSNRSSTFCTLKRCYQAIGAAYTCPLFLCILNYLYFEIVKKTKYITYGPPPFNVIDAGDEEKLQIFRNACKFLHVHDCGSRKVDMYIVEMSSLAKNHPVLHTMHFWTFSVLIKLIPCVVLTFFMLWLVNTLYKARRRHNRMLERNTGYPMSSVAQNGEIQPLSPSKQSKTVHPEPEKSVVVSRKGLGNGKNVRLGEEEEEEDPQEGSPKKGLLAVDGRNTCHLSTGPNSPNPSLVPGDNDSTTGGVDSRRTSGESGKPVVVGACRRFTKGIIRFTSIRRGSEPKSKSHKSSKRTDRTSKMLIAVLLLFLLTEFPQGIMHFLTGWYGPEFFRCSYNPSGEVWDLLALINSAINFILYCFMSKQFRTQFSISFKLHLCFKRPKWMSMANCNNNATVSTTV